MVSNVTMSQWAVTAGGSRQNRYLAANQVCRRSSMTAGTPGTQTQISEDCSPEENPDQMIEHQRRKNGQ